MYVKQLLAPRSPPSHPTPLPQSMTVVVPHGVLGPVGAWLSWQGAYRSWGYVQMLNPTSSVADAMPGLVFSVLCQQSIRVVEPWLLNTLQSLGGRGS